MYRLYFKIDDPWSGTLVNPREPMGQLLINKWANEPNRVFVEIAQKSDMYGMMYQSGQLVPTSKAIPPPPEDEFLTLLHRIEDLEDRIFQLESGS